MIVAEMRMFRSMSEVTREGKIRNKYVRDSIKVTSIVDIIKENRLRWLGRVLKREETEVLRLVKEMYVNGKRGKGRLRKRGGVMENYFRIVGVSEKDAR